MAQRWWRPSHLVLVAGAAYLLLISLKFRHVLDLAASNLAASDLATTDHTFSSPFSSDHLPPITSNRNATLFQVQPFWHRYDRIDEGEEEGLEVEGEVVVGERGEGEVEEGEVEPSVNSGWAASLSPAINRRREGGGEEESRSDGVRWRSWSQPNTTAPASAPP